ncbi:MAG TPA: 50S ribosomal protein L20, partial [Candidatus Vogelbacteria bacterium]|nr:50S ribosomal protein L20 [Candidatus Vogelbacteria bacterium]
GALKKKGSVLDRKVLSQLAQTEPDTFSSLVKEVMA